MKKVGCVILLIFISQILFIACGNEKGEYSIKYPKSTEFELGDKSKNFNYKYTVNLRQVSKKENEVEFLLQMYPKDKKEFKDLKVTAYINDDVFKSFGHEVINHFGTVNGNQINIDENNKELMMERSTWLEKDANIQELIKNINEGIKVEVSWENGEENVLIKDVNINNTIE